MDKLQRAGRDFLMRLIAEHGLAGAVKILRGLADELEQLERPVGSEAMLQQYLDDMRAALAAGNYYSALALAMAIPDICGSIDTLNADGDIRYKEWFNTWCMAPMGHMIDGVACYSLRCAYLHSGREDLIPTRRTNPDLDRISFHTGGHWPAVGQPSGLQRIYHPQKPGTKARVEISVAEFCGHIAQRRRAVAC
jgi:hypothetical protein